MTRVLTASSIVYAGILVVALAGILATILVLLVRVTRILGRVQDRLRDVVRYTQPLAGQLGAVTTAAVSSADEISHGVDAFVTAAGDDRDARSNTGQ